MYDIKIIYIDDNMDTLLERYLNEELSLNEIRIIYGGIQFNPVEGYRSLIQNPNLQSANILIVDLRLFENRTAVTGKFTGEELKFILRKIFPFIEVIVVTQNDADNDTGTIPKYRSNVGETATDYYNTHLLPLLKQSIKNLKIYWKLAEEFQANVDWEPIVKEKVMNSFQGLLSYDEISKADIDEIINEFRMIQGLLS